MKEIEEQILARKDELTAAPAGSDTPKNTDAPAAASDSNGSGSDDDILVDIDEDFDEFTPAEE